MQTLSILVTSAGRRNELIELFRSDARELGFIPRIVAADLRPEWSSACHAADKAVGLPRADSTEYADAVFSIIEQEDIQLVAPTIDTELLALAASRNEWERQRPGLFVVSHGPEFVAFCRNKAATMVALRTAGVDTPVNYFLPGQLAEPINPERWPLLAKPIGGSSSKGVRDICDKHEFDIAVREAGTLIQEKVQGAEYTVNAYVDREGRILAVAPHRRIATRGGEVEKGVIESFEGVEEIVQKAVAAVPGARGPFNLQGIRRDDGSFAVFEVNGRFGGGYPLAHRAGAKFTRWAIEEGVMGRCIEPTRIEEGWRMMRHDTSVFVRGGNA